ncbi:DUF6503 family protein [Portibacter lacus]|uniref:Outer membrane lipoprotein-sorting protein n=1 Tax=Portibacter lacus TaxID=1099794 RepID=A0AA37WFB0_9BACT|nr:DUF6503 family protein [Portibacter lacus]GLR16845.1 hypothetical protein GCM10007940_14600 [Portibacter lacus]
MYKYFYLLTLLFTNCIIHAQSSAEEIISQSIAVHDPSGNWHKLHADIEIASIVERENKVDTSYRLLQMDLKNELFKMTSFSAKDTSEVIYDGKPCDDCDRAKMFNNYFRYLLGMPMKLRDPGTIIHEEIQVLDYKGVPYQVVKVTYDPEIGSDTWLFYFHPKTSVLELVEFSKDGTFQSGETIELNNKIKYQKMLLPGQLKWLVLPDRRFLAEENIKYSIPKK